MRKKSRENSPESRDKADDRPECAVVGCHAAAVGRRRRPRFDTPLRHLIIGSTIHHLSARAGYEGNTGTERPSRVVGLGVDKKIYSINFHIFFVSSEVGRTKAVYSCNQCNPSAPRPSQARPLPPAGYGGCMHGIIIVDVIILALSSALYAVASW